MSIIGNPGLGFGPTGGGSCDYPATSDVRDGVLYDFGNQEGTFSCPTTTTTTTTTPDPNNCQTNVVDNDLVCFIKQQLNISNVYHLSAYQQLSPNEVFPCAVYERGDDQKFGELANDSGMTTTTFNVYLICPDSSTLRDWARLLACGGGIPYTGNGWLWVDNDVEQYDIPVELQELGERQTLVVFTYIHQGKS